jgi:ribose transport system substrate-binding protein
MKRVVLAVLAAMVLAAPTGDAAKLKFAVVPKAMNNPFFDIARDGCMKRAKELGNVECVYRGPIEHEPATQVQIIQDLITQRVDGLAISVSDVGADTGVIKAARDAGIPVITFDADAPGSAREAYIGTNNKDFGRALGEMLVKAQPRAGTYGMVSGGPAAANLNERLEGVREVVGKADWKEVSGSPTYCNDDAALAVQQLNDLTTAHPDLNAVVPVGGWPLFVPEGYRNFVDNACAALFQKLPDIVFGHPIDAGIEDLRRRLAVMEREQCIHRLLAHLERTLSHERSDVALFEELQLGG